MSVTVGSLASWGGSGGVAWARGTLPTPTPLVSGTVWARGTLPTSTPRVGGVIWTLKHAYVYLCPTYFFVWFYLLIIPLFDWSAPSFRTCSQRYVHTPYIPVLKVISTLPSSLCSGLCTHSLYPCAQSYVHTPYVPMFQSPSNKQKTQIN